MDGKPNGFTYNAAPEPNDIGFDKGTFFYFHEKSCWTMAEPFPIFLKNLIKEPSKIKQFWES